MNASPRMPKDQVVHALVSGKLLSYNIDVAACGRVHDGFLLVNYAGDFSCVDGTYCKESGSNAVCTADLTANSPCTNAGNVQATLMSYSC